MSVESVRLRLLLVGPLRLVLGAVWLGASRAAGGSPSATLLAFAAGPFALAFFAFNPTLAALLGGVLAGLGLAAALSAYSIDRRLYVDPRRGALCRK